MYKRQEQDIVERVFNLGDRDISSVMTHRSELIRLNIREDNATIKEKIIQELHAVYPVCDGESLDHLIGVVSLKELFGKLDVYKRQVHYPGTNKIW